MKQLKLKLLLLCLITSFLFFQNCSKDTLVNPNVEGMDLLMSLQDREDLENDKVTEIQYHFANAFNQLMLVTDIKPALVDEVKKSEIGQITILNFIQNQDLETQFNVHLSESLKTTRNFENVVHDKDLANVLANKMVHKDILYYPVLTFLQSDIDQLDSDKIAIGIGEELDEEENIYSFLGNEIIKLNEKSIKSFSGLLLVVNNHVDPYDVVMPSNDNANIVKPTNAELRADDTTVKIKSYRVKNGYRYESSGDTDYRVKIMRYFDPTSPTDTDWKTFSIKKSEVQASKLFTTNTTVLSTTSDFYPGSPPNVYALHATGVLTFEYDWNQSSKAFDCVCNNGFDCVDEDYAMSGRRKYWGDTYDIKCDTDTYFFEANYGYENQNSSTKSTHSLQRVDL